MRAHSSLKQEASKEENAQDYDDGDNDDLDKSHNVTSRNADCADFKFAPRALSTAFLLRIVNSFWWMQIQENTEGFSTYAGGPLIMKAMTQLDVKLARF